MVDLVTKNKQNVKKKKMGRPVKYKKSMCAIVEEELSKGLSKEATCPKLGITPSTMYEWIKTRKDFSDAVGRGEAAGLSMYENILRAASTGTKVEQVDKDGKKTDVMPNVKEKSLHFLMSRRYPRLYGEKSFVDHSSKDGSMSPKPATPKSIEELKEELRKMREANDLTD